MRGRKAEQQMAIVMATLNSLLPPGAADRFKAWFPPNKFSCEANAAITGWKGRVELLGRLNW